MKRSIHIFLVIIISFVAYGLTTWYLKKHIVHYTVPPSHIIVDATDSSTGKRVFTTLKVTSALPMDTVRKFKEHSIAHFERKFLFHQNPTFLVWIMLVSIMMALAAGSCMGFIAMIAQLCRKFRATPVTLIISAGSAVALVLALAFFSPPIPGYCYPRDIVRDFHILLDDGSIFKSIERLTLSLCAPALTLIFLCGLLGAGISIRKNMTASVCRRKAGNLLRLGRSLLTALQVMSVTVAFSVLTSTTLGLSINATLFINGFDLYPKEISFVYGMLFSVFLGIIYLPIHLFLQRRYGALKEVAEGISFMSREERKDFLEETFGDKLFESSAIDNLKMILTVLAPLISGLLPGLLDGLK